MNTVFFFFRLSLWGRCQPLINEQFTWISFVRIWCEIKWKALGNCFRIGRILASEHDSVRITSRYNTQTVFFCSFISGLCRWASVGISCTNLGWNPIWHFVHAPYAVCVYVSACVGIIWSIQYAPLLHNERRIGQVWLVSSTRAHLYPAHTSSSLILQNNVPLYSTEYESFITLRIYTYAALHTWKYTIFNSNYFEFRRRNYY